MIAEFQRRCNFQAKTVGPNATAVEIPDLPDCDTCCEDVFLVRLPPPDRQHPDGHLGR